MVRTRRQIELLANDVDERGSRPTVEEVLRLLDEERKKILLKLEIVSSRRSFPVEESDA